MRPYSPGGLLIALASARQDWVPATPSNHRLGLGLPGYLILFAPLAFVHQRQLWSSTPLSPQVFLPISTHFTLHREFHAPLPYSSTTVSPAGSELSPEISQVTCGTAYAPFTPNNSEQRLHPLYYRGCWHRVSRCFFHQYRHYRLGRKEFTPQGASSSTRRCCVRVSPIAQNSPLLPPVGVCTVFQFQCVRAPSQAGYRSSPWWAVTPPTS